MAAIDFRSKTIKYYDSMGSANNKCLQVNEILLKDSDVLCVRIEKAVRVCWFCLVNYIFRS
jgi:hypothetical protein